MSNACHVSGDSTTDTLFDFTDRETVNCDVEAGQLLKIAQCLPIGTEHWIQFFRVSAFALLNHKIF